jgi:hypothetical protein
VGKYTSLLFVAMLTGTASARGSSIPVYYFNGGAAYDASTETLSTIDPNTGLAMASLFQSANLPPPLSVVPGVNDRGSAIDLTMTLVPSTIVDNGLQTTASFAATAQEAALYLGNGSGGTATTPVLTGTLSNITLSGPDGLNMGFLTAYLHPNGGAAFAYFSDPSSVLALNFDLTATFGADMFGTDFSGQINGQVQSMTSVPLPASFVLLALGAALMFALTRASFASARRRL